MKHALECEESADESEEAVAGRKHRQKQIQRTWLPNSGDLDDPGLIPRFDDEESEHQD